MHLRKYFNICCYINKSHIFINFLLCYGIRLLLIGYMNKQSSVNLHEKMCETARKKCIRIRKNVDVLVSFFQACNRELNINIFSD